MGSFASKSGKTEPVAEQAEGAKMRDAAEPVRFGDEGAHPPPTPPEGNPQAADAQDSEESSIKARGRKGLIAKNQTFLVRDGDSLTVDQDEAALGPQVDG